MNITIEKGKTFYVDLWISLAHHVSFQCPGFTEHRHKALNPPIRFKYLDSMVYRSTKVLLTLLYSGFEFLWALRSVCDKVERECIGRRHKDRREGVDVIDSGQGVSVILKPLFQLILQNLQNGGKVDHQIVKE